MPIQAKPVPSSGGKTSAILAPSKPAFRLHSRPADDWSSWEKRGKSLPNRSATYLSRMQATPAGRHCHCHCSEFGVDAPYAFHHAGDQYQQLRERVTAERNALHRRQQPSDVAQSAPRKTGAVASAHAKKDVTGVTTTSVRFDLDGEHSSHMQSAAPAGEDGSFAGDATFYRNDELAQRGAGSAGTPSDPSVSNSFVVISDNEPEVEVSVIEDELYGDARTPESGLASFSQTSKSVKPVTQFSSFVRHREERMVAVAYQHKLIEIHKIIRKMKKEHCACGPSAKVNSNLRTQKDDKSTTNVTRKYVHVTEDTGAKTTNSVRSNLQAPKTISGFHRDETYDEFHRTPLYIARPNVFRDYEIGKTRQEFRSALNKAYRRVG